MRKYVRRIADKMSLTTITVLDVGSRWGIQRPIINLPIEYLKYYGFEADEKECTKLNRKTKSNNITYLPVALSNKA